jgi:hypothetical protein
VEGRKMNINLKRIREERKNEGRERRKEILRITTTMAHPNLTNEVLGTEQWLYNFQFRNEGC